MPTQGKRDRKSPGVRQNGAEHVSRAEFEAVVKLLDERGEIINEIRRELQATCRDLAENVRRDLQTQFMRIAQIQQEIDELRRKNGR